MDPQEQPPRVWIVKPGVTRPRRSLGEWIHAWKTVMRDPDKVIPDAGIGPEGQPIPEELDIRCQSCGCRLAGATEWACPDCGEPFNPLRLYTLRMMQEPEYFLRYRMDPDDIRKAFYALVMVVLGLLLALVATVVALKRGSTGRLPIATAWSGMSIIIGLTVPVTAAVHYVMDIPIARILFFFSMPWFLLCAALLVIAFL